MKYCSHCGSNNIDFKIPEGDFLPRHCCTDCGTVHYQNPNMVVGCLIVQDEKILLARRGIEPRKGFWNLPCGFLELNETVEDGAKREVMEEIGADVEVGPLHTVYNIPHAHQVYLIFLAKMLRPEYHLTTESTEIRFFEKDEIPWKEIAFSSNSFAIEKYLDHGNIEPHRLHLGTYYKQK